jgi:hypothetical protein
MLIYYPEKPTCEKVLELQKLPQLEQKSQEWLDARQTCISASDISSALLQSEDSCNYFLESFENVDGFEFKIEPTKNCNKYSTKHELVLKKCNLGKPFTGNIYTLHGQKYEQIVSNVYSQINQIDVHEFGLLKHPIHSFLGASPDGITSEGRMIEIKCPPSRKVKPYPSLPYFHQMLLQLECTGLKECDFFDAHFVEFTDVETWTREATLWWLDNPDCSHHIYGIIASIVNNNGDEEHMYASPLIRTMDEFIEWASMIEKANVKLTYYKLHEYYITRVYHSQDWFKRNLPDFKEMWDLIEYHRTPIGKKELEDVVNSKKRVKKSPVVVYSKYKESLFT